jgi:Tfp pilus assembly protein PilF
MLLATGAVLRARRAQSAAAAPVVVTASSTVSTAATPPPAAAAPRPRDPAKAKELVQRASEWQAANDTGTARDLLEKAIDLDPDNAEAHYRLGGLFLNSQPDRARTEYEAARRLNSAKYADVVDTILKGL